MISAELSNRDSTAYSRDQLLEDDEVKLFEAGFANAIEQIQPISLTVKGQIPSWLTGHLYRPAPSNFSIDTDSGKMVKVDHWFDGLTSIHKFSIFEDGSVQYMNRKTTEDLENSIKKSGHISFGFGKPCPFNYPVQF